MGFWNNTINKLNPARMFARGESKENEEMSGEPQPLGQQRGEKAAQPATPAVPAQPAQPEAAQPAATAAPATPAQPAQSQGDDVEVTVASPGNPPASGGSLADRIRAQKAAEDAQRQQALADKDAEIDRLTNALESSRQEAEAARGEADGFRKQLEESQSTVQQLQADKSRLESEIADVQALFGV